MNKTTLISAAALGLLLSAQNGFSADTTAKTEPAKKEAVMGECHGVNTCKGQGKCGGQNHECAGKNTCKGQGWVEMTEKACKAKKGKWAAAGSGMNDYDQKNAPEAKKN